MLTFVFLSFLGSCNHDLNTPFGTFLKRECNSSASSNQYFIPLSGGVPFSRQNLANCSQPQYPLIGDLFNSVACSSGQWRIMNVSCECGSQADYTPSCSALTSSAPSISNCVFQFSRSDSNVEDAVVFITGLTHSERNDLLAYFRPCVSNEMVDCSISSTPPSTSPSISMMNQGKAAKSGENKHNNLFSYPVYTCLCTVVCDRVVCIVIISQCSSIQVLTSGGISIPRSTYEISYYLATCNTNLQFSEWVLFPVQLGSLPLWLRSYLILTLIVYKCIRGFFPLLISLLLGKIAVCLTRLTSPALWCLLVTHSWAPCSNNCYCTCTLLHFILLYKYILYVVHVQLAQVI